MKRSWCLMFLASAAFGAADLPTPADYRKLMLGMQKEAHFTLNFPGLKPAAVSYKIEWKLERMNEEPAKIQEPVDADLRTWKDRLWTNEETSWLFVENQAPIRVFCVYVQGRDNQAEDRKRNVPQYTISTFIVGNDPECRGPANVDPKIYLANNQMWEHYLFFKIRNIEKMLPSDPIKIRLYGNEANLVRNTWVKAGR